MQVVRQVDAYHHPSRRRVNGHVVRGVIQKLCARVTLNVMRIKVTPAKLHVDPELVRTLLIERIVCLAHERRLTNRPLVRGEEQNVGARAVHLVRLSRVNRFLLNRFNL